MRQQLEKNIAYLPVPYRCAIERLDGIADRTFPKLRELCDAYAATYGMQHSEEHSYFCDSAAAICSRRFGMVA